MESSAPEEYCDADDMRDACEAAKARAAERYLLCHRALQLRRPLPDVRIDWASASRELKEERIVLQRRHAEHERILREQVRAAGVHAGHVQWW